MTKIPTIALHAISSAWVRLQRTVTGLVPNAEASHPEALKSWRFSPLNITDGQYLFLGFGNKLWKKISSTERPIHQEGPKGTKEDQKGPGGTRENQEGPFCHEIFLGVPFRSGYQSWAVYLKLLYINACLKVFWQISKKPIWLLTLVLAWHHFFVVFSFEIQTWSFTQHGYNHQF